MARSKGTGSVEPCRDGHRLRWTDARGERHSVIFRPSSKKEAEVRLRDIQAGLVAPEQPTRSIRLEAFAREYLTARETVVAPGTYRNWKSLLNGPLRPLADHSLDQLTQRTIDIWWARQGQHPVNRRNAYFMLRAMMRTAVRWGYIDAWAVTVDNAGRDVAAKRPDWTVADFDAVLVKLDPFYRAPIEVLFAGHLRLGELVALNGSDYRDGVISVTRQKTSQGLTKGTKSGQVKTIKLLGRGVTALATRPRVIGETPLFAGERAERITRLSIRNAWLRACEKAGRENFHLHDLRHISLSLVAEVAPLKVVQQRAGHASATSTQCYMHADARQHMEAVEKTDALIRRIS